MGEVLPGYLQNINKLQPGYIKFLHNSEHSGYLVFSLVSSVSGLQCLKFHYDNVRLAARYGAMQSVQCTAVSEDKENMARYNSEM